MGFMIWGEPYKGESFNLTMILKDNREESLEVTEVLLKSFACFFLFLQLYTVKFLY